MTSQHSIGHSTHASDSQLGLQIVRFLLDRIDEDESELERLARQESRAWRPVVIGTGVRAAEQLRGNLIAKRHLIGDLQQLLVLRDLPVEAPVRHTALSALHAMCLPYRDHRRFDPAWEPRIHGAGHEALDADDEQLTA